MLPPIACGMNPAPKVTALSRAELVALKTSTDSARVRSVSASSMSSWPTTMIRNSGSAKISPYVVRLGSIWSCAAIVPGSTVQRTTRKAFLCDSETRRPNVSDHPLPPIATTGSARGPSSDTALQSCGRITSWPCTTSAMPRIWHTLASTRSTGRTSCTTAPTRLVHLVAHHSQAALEAERRGLSAELAEFPASAARPRACSAAGHPRERCAAGGVDADVPGFDPATTAGWRPYQGEPGRSAALCATLFRLLPTSRRALARVKPRRPPGAESSLPRRRARSPGTWPYPAPPRGAA
ncbi:hypothetical protein DFQ14_104261 [Halopolyspora algeriensis]|uniref:Uncharacterized protein n=1 Tax=Halopolyspora algeriensis TaxID=1500506 RepID=A0A368VSE9_9ACTN|nr:hypothetical protein DFQ14_104261 [Halopolyspora algeriensis]TQM56030.1 hypothetical protein FHU43_0811 [Halopolyspora algeriensis]